MTEPEINITLDNTEVTLIEVQKETTLVIEGPDDLILTSEELTLEVIDTPIVLTPVADLSVLEVAVPGLQGPPGSIGPVGSAGPAGPQGPAGPPGSAGGTYTHTQNVPSDTWTIVHYLGFMPNISIIDSGGSNVEGETTYIDTDTVVLTFTSAFGGVAYLS